MLQLLRYVTIKGSYTRTRIELMNGKTINIHMSQNNGARSIKNKRNFFCHLSIIGVESESQKSNHNHIVGLSKSISVNNENLKMTEKISQKLRSWETHKRTHTQKVR